MSPKVSVLMSVYNGDRFLKESIDSILSQTFTDFEFIIVNDASTDKTPDILKSYSFRDPRIKIITNEVNLGLTKSLNVGIRNSKGEYVARLDAGDISEKDRLLKEVKFLDDNLEYVLVGTGVLFVDSDDRVIKEIKVITENEKIKRNLIKHNQFIHSSIMIRREVLEKVGLYNEEWKYAQDYELYFRLCRYGKVANLPDYLVKYVVYENSITRKKNRKQISFSVRARVEAIIRGDYPFWNYIYILAPLIGMILPYKLKEKIKKL